MAKQITADQVAAAEANLQAVKKKKKPDPDEKREAMQALADLRTAFRVQEEAAGRRTGLVSIIEGN